MNSISKNEKIFLFIIFFGLFFFPHAIRMQIFHSISQRSYLWNINFISDIGIIMLYLYNAKNSVNFSSVFKPQWHYIIPAIALIPLFVSMKTNQYSFGYFVVYVLCCVLPLSVLFYTIKSDTKDHIIAFLLRIYNAIIIILVITALMDSIFDNIVIKHLADFFTIDHNFNEFAYAAVGDTERNRFYSIYGHPLENATLFNMFFILNYTYNKASANSLLPMRLCPIITFLGISCCDSKGGLIIFLGLMLIAYYNNIKLLASVAIMIIIVVCSGLLDDLIVRLTTQEISNGRFSGLSSLLQSTETPLRFFVGYGDISKYGPYSPVFEFSGIVMAFNYGILFSILILGTIFVFCSHKFLSAKKYQAFLFWLLFFAEINTYNFMAHTLDSSLIYCFLTMLLINLSITSQSN